MPELASLIAFGFIALGMVLTPGPNMIYIITQIIVSVSVNAVIAMLAGTIAVFLAGRPAWLVAQRWLMGTVLAGLALRMATEARR